MFCFFLVFNSCENAEWPDSSRTPFVFTPSPSWANTKKPNKKWPTESPSWKPRRTPKPTAEPITTYLPTETQTTSSSETKISPTNTPSSTTPSEPTNTTSSTTPTKPNVDPETSNRAEKSTFEKYKVEIISGISAGVVLIVVVIVIVIVVVKRKGRKEKSSIYMDPILAPGVDLI